MLIDCVGGKHGVYKDHAEFLEKYFRLITMKEYLENKSLGRKIRAVYQWFHKPVVNQELLQSLPNLEVVASAGVGIDHLDLKLLSSHGVKVSNTPLVVSTDTADLGMALMLASSRRIVEGNSCNGFDLFVGSPKPATRQWCADAVPLEVQKETSPARQMCSCRQPWVQASSLSPEPRNASPSWLLSCVSGSDEGRLAGGSKPVLAKLASV